MPAKISGEAVLMEAVGNSAASLSGAVVLLDLQGATAGHVSGAAVLVEIIPYIFTLASDVGHTGYSLAGGKSLDRGQLVGRRVKRSRG